MASFRHLLYRGLLSLILGITRIGLPAQNNAAPPADTFYRIAFYNAENFFDPLHDSGKNDHDFTPMGIKGWGNAKYTQKRNNLFKVVAALNAERPLAALGMAEVENARVLRDLCRGTPLRHLGFDFVHFESRDPRGIDVALLYRRDLLAIDTAFVYPLVIPPDTVSRTRDILYVRALPRTGVGLPDTLHLLVNHFPSKYGGVLQTEGKRAAAARLLRQVMDSLHAVHPQGFILAMGDFNTTPQDEVLSRLDSVPFVNLMKAAGWPGKTGSHKYREEWSTIDHIYLERSMLAYIDRGRAFLFDRNFLLMPDERYLGQKPFRTFYGAAYLGGYSDHLPVYIDLKFP
ncbi:MAG: endonuclease [Bacteroides sp.]|nr:endonuclease [Bacteroides sp.]